MALPYATAPATSRDDVLSFLDTHKKEMRSRLDLIPPDIQRESAFYLSPEELVQYSATSGEVRAALANESFCKDYYNHRVPSDLQLSEAPLGVPFCTVIRALPKILQNVVIIQAIVMQWERCVAPTTAELIADPNRRLECQNYRTERLQPTIHLESDEGYGYLLRPRDSREPGIQLLFGSMTRWSPGLESLYYYYRLTQRLGEWSVPASQLRHLLVALVATDGYLFPGTANYRIGLIVFNLSTRETLEQAEGISRQRDVRRTARELPFTEELPE